MNLIDATYSPHYAREHAQSLHAAIQGRSYPDSQRRPRWFVRFWA